MFNEETHIKTYGKTRLDPIAWYNELPTDRERCENVLKSLQQRLGFIASTGEQLQANIPPINKGASVLEKDIYQVAREYSHDGIGLVRSFSNDLHELEIQGLDTTYGQIKDRILKSIRDMIREEKRKKGIDNNNVIDIPTNMPAKLEQSQKGILDLWELEAVSKAYEYLQEQWGTPVRKITGKDALALVKLKKRNIVDI